MNEFICDSHLPGDIRHMFQPCPPHLPVFPEIRAPRRRHIYRSALDNTTNMSYHSEEQTTALPVHSPVHFGQNEAPRFRPLAGLDAAAGRARRGTHVLSADVAVGAAGPPGKLNVLALVRGAGDGPLLLMHDGGG